jgi:hypothetical protein
MRNDAGARTAKMPLGLGYPPSSLSRVLAVKAEAISADSPTR